MPTKRNIKLFKGSHCWFNVWSLDSCLFKVKLVQDMYLGNPATFVAKLSILDVYRGSE